jgi:hypothetical protein
MNNPVHANIETTTATLAPCFEAAVQMLDMLEHGGRFTFQTLGKSPPRSTWSNIGSF